jgi:hypothetical protein
MTQERKREQKLGLSSNLARSLILVSMTQERKREQKPPFEPTIGQFIALVSMTQERKREQKVTHEIIPINCRNCPIDS